MCVCVRVRVRVCVSVCVCWGRQSMCLARRSIIVRDGRGERGREGGHRSISPRRVSVASVDEYVESAAGGDG